MTVPSDAARLLTSDPLMAHLATCRDGRPHVAPVWYVYDESTETVELVTTGRKLANVRENPRVGLSMTAPDDPYRFLSVRGVVDEVTEDGAVDHIDALAARYMGVDEYPNHGDEDGARVLLKIRPEHVAHS